jgi:hypothetical protein
VDQGGAPSVISWFISHTYWSYKCTNLAIPTSRTSKVGKIVRQLIGGVEVDFSAGIWRPPSLGKTGGATHLYLVGGLEHDFYFSIYWEFHNPNWLSYFSEGLKPPTSYISVPTLKERRYSRLRMFANPKIMLAFTGCFQRFRWTCINASCNVEATTKPSRRGMILLPWAQATHKRLLAAGVAAEAVLGLDGGLPHVAPGCHLPWLDDENKP